MLFLLLGKDVHHFLVIQSKAISSVDYWFSNYPFSMSKVLSHPAWVGGTQGTMFYTCFNRFAYTVFFLQ